MKFKRVKNKLILIALIIVIFIGSWLRLHGIFSNSFAFTYDVGRDLLATKNIVENHDVMLIGPTTGLEGLFYGPVWYYILAVPFVLSGGNPQFIAFFIALTGIAAVTIGFFVGKKIDGIFLGFVFASFLAFSPAVIEYGTQIWSPDLIPFFMVSAIFVLSLIFQKKVMKYNVLFFFLGLLLSLVTDMEIVFGLLLSFGVMCSLFIFKKSLLSLKSIFFLAGFSIPFLSRILFEFLHQFLMTKSVLHAISQPKEHTSFIQPLLNIPNRAHILFGLFANTVTGGNQLVASAVLLFCIGVVYVTYKKIHTIEKRFLYICLIVIATYLIGLSFFAHDIWSHYMTGLPIIYLLLLSLILLFTKKYIRNGKKISYVIFGIMLLININPIRLYNSLRDPLWEGNAAVYRNQVAAVDTIYKQAKGEKFKYIVYTPALLDYPYRYLFSWYGKKYYGYEPSQQNVKLFFVVLEPDFDMPSRQTDWLKQREGDGKIVKEVKSKGGIVVQTRRVH
jgi:4-amino-4-deoxy-L-arabinose transferase-like glycosyltransferase